MWVLMTGVKSIALNPWCAHFEERLLKWHIVEKLTLETGSELVLTHFFHWVCFCLGWSLIIIALASRQASADKK